MPSRQRLNEFIDRVVGGDHVGAIADFYHADASMQENLKPPRVGRDVLMENERKALARVRAVVTHRPEHVVLDGDTVVIHWMFDFTGHDGITRRLIELALQQWDGDCIRREQFFYDTATAWQVVAPLT